MQTVRIIYRGQPPGYVSYYATSDNSPTNRTETSGDAQGSMEWSQEWAIKNVKQEFAVTPEDTIYVNGELYQESSITIAERKDAEAAEAERQRLKDEEAAREAAEKAEQERLAQEAASVSSPELTQGVTSPPQTQGVSDRLMNIINTLIAQKSQVQDSGDANIKDYENQIVELKKQIAEAKDTSETAKIEELTRRIDELNTQKAQAQAVKETDIKDLERQISDLKKPEQSGLSQIPIKIIAAVGGAILLVILLFAVILRGKK
jgi:polyhydroxyalkanoate synthesis regulator phasin